MEVDITLEHRVVCRCAALGRTFAVAESCSGGLIAHRITNVPGASAVFQGGVVAYANEAKMRLLHVPEALLTAHGAVSEAVACAMAQGARSAFDAAYSVAVTGIAGPGGGTPEKPVGTVCIAASGPEKTSSQRHLFAGERDAVKLQTADAALNLLLQLMDES